MRFPCSHGEAAVPLQPLEVHGDAEIHLQPVEEDPRWSRDITTISNWPAFASCPSILEPAGIGSAGMEEASSSFLQKPPL
ncbi:hypothetical protein DUI87_03194 [Hirundo rustica rustica]|uniref:Uncharacterized protein n=1 Tax=Hirundo rustica rustica TaxID=333673 RepID=A0A3M0L2W3_HIRRU|nr:hypothetical protein DUI87_03194 [Hirundo rustica rustica]